MTIKFTGSEEDGEEVIELLRLIAEVMKDRKNEENDDEIIK